MINRRPAILNYNQDDPTGNTWALPEGATVRFGKGKQGGVRLSPCGKYFSIATGIGVWWFDVPSMLPISLWDFVKGGICSVDFTNGGNWIVLGNWDQVLNVFDVQTANRIYQLDFQGDYITISSNCTRIASSDAQGIVRMFNPQSGEYIAQMDRGEHKWKANDIKQLQFSPNDKFLAGYAGNPPLLSNDTEDYNQPLNPDSEEGQIYVWYPDSGKAILKFTGTILAFSPDSKLLAGSCPDDTYTDDIRMDDCLSVWDIESGERIALFLGHDDWIDAVTISPCGKYVASSDGTLRVWDLTSGSQTMVYPELNYPFYSDEGELFAFESFGTLQPTAVWNVNQQKKVLEISNGIGGMDFKQSLATSYIKEQIQHPTKGSSINNTDSPITLYTIPNEVRFPWPDPKGIWVDNQTLGSKSFGQGVLLWDVTEKRFKGNLFKGNLNKGEWIGSYTVLPAGRILASHISENSKVWDLSKTNTPIAEFTAPPEPSEWARDAVFSPTGDRIAVGSRTGTIFIWNFEEPDNPIKLIGHTDHIWTLAFSPDGKRLVSSGDDITTRVWDVELGEQITILPVSTPLTYWGLVFSPCGEFIVGGTDNEIRFWCAEKLTTIRTIPQPENSLRSYTLTFSSDGSYLASGTWYQEGMNKMAIRLWDVATGENIHTFWGHNSDIQSLAFSPDGTKLASSGFDYTILVWDLKPYL